MRRVVVDQDVSPTAAAGAGSSRSLRDMLRFTRAVRRAAPSVFFSPSVYTYFPLPLGLPAVVTVHDAIAERFPALTLPNWKARLFWRLKVRLALWQTRLVLTDSDYAAREVSEVLGVRRDRLRVTILAPADVYRAPKDEAAIRGTASQVGIPSGARWIVYVGGFNPHKHVDLLVRAHARIAGERSEPLYLVLVGAVDGDVFHGALADIRDAIQEVGTTELVRWPGFVPDEQLRHLLGGAVALVLASASEGFGLPAVEAAACGTPVIATTASPLPELLAGGGIFVPPGSVDAIAGALRTLLDDELARAAMGAMARVRATALTWDTGADVALAALREAAT